ncbi:MAG: HD domain-containing phosphohydrolase [Gammaproteobacteria bacterium]|nr:HD domain-containing phosphohydrolase [Gammaproteobacteria bacterium]
MNKTHSADELRTSSVVIAVLALVLVVGIGAALINAYVNRERQRDLQQWESRLGLVADAKVAALDSILADDIRVLQELADNASVQLYLGQLTGSDGAAGPQSGYLRNLLLATAVRMDLEASAASRVPANLPQPDSPGLGLFTPALQPMVTTPGVNARHPELGAAAAAAIAERRPVIAALYRDGQDRSMLGIVIPVGPVLGSEGQGDGRAVGLLLAIRAAEQRLFPALSAGAPFAQDHETLLLARRGDQVQYLNPGRDGTAALRRSLPLSRGRLAAADAVSRPGQFASLDNYLGRPVLQVSRKLRFAPWVLALQVDATQALRESNARRQFLITTLSLILLAVVALYVAAWRHGSGVRARHEAEEQAEKAAKLRRQTELLHAITDNIAALTLLVDQGLNILFTNEAMANAVGSTIPDLIDKRLSAALGAAVARELQRGAEIAIRDREPSGQTLRLQFGAELRNYRASFLPIVQLGDLSDLTLIVLDDVTELELAQARHTNMLSNLVSTLAEVIDLHDPYSAFHSARMAEVASELAIELRMSDQDRQTLEFAATLANIGKIMIPREVLTKTEELTEDERKLLETHVGRGLELLHNLDFDGPVLSTIAQKQELLDGTGYPRHLYEAQMTLPGKVLAVANAFVALVSPRAYRDALPATAALERLLSEADDKYDRQVVAALVHVAENRLDWSRWSRRGGAG